MRLQCRRPQFDSWVRKILWRRDRLPTPVFVDFPDGSDGKESTCNSGDLGLIPGLGRSSGGGHGNPLHYSCLDNPHGQRSLAGYNSWGHKVRHGWVTKLSIAQDFPDGSEGKNPPVLQETQEVWLQFLGREDPLEEGMATHSSTVAWKIPWTEEPGSL